MTTLGQPDREEEQDQPFSFAEHRRLAVENYLRIRSQYEDFATAVAAILSKVLEGKKIAVTSIQVRAKTPESFGAKVETRAGDDPGKPKYKEPLNDIRDLAGVRIITLLPSTTSAIAEYIEKEFEVFGQIDHSAKREAEEDFGYESVHFEVGLTEQRAALPEYILYKDLIAEIQVRTTLQHAWAEIEHEIQYKPSVAASSETRRRFKALAGMLAIADREFQAIQDKEDLAIQDSGSTTVEQDERTPEITTEGLRSYLDEKVGSDARVSNSSYDWMARTLRQMGFTTFEQVDQCIADYDDDELSRISWGGRQGPIKRFEDMLLAGMGCLFVERSTRDPEWRDMLNQTFADYRDRNIPVRQYDPRTATSAS